MSNYFLFSPTGSFLKLRGAVDLAWYEDSLYPDGFCGGNVRAKEQRGCRAWVTHSLHHIIRCSVETVENNMMSHNQSLLSNFLSVVTEVS